MTDQQRLRAPDDGRPASAHELSIIAHALDSLVTQKDALGNFVVINIATGEYLTGKSLVEVCDRFQTTFAGATGFAHVVGEPLYEPLLL